MQALAARYTPLCLRLSGDGLISAVLGLLVFASPEAARAEAQAQTAKAAALIADTGYHRCDGGLANCKPASPSLSQFTDALHPPATVHRGDIADGPPLAAAPGLTMTTHSNAPVGDIFAVNLFWLILARPIYFRSACALKNP